VAGPLPFPRPFWAEVDDPGPEIFLEDPGFVYGPGPGLSHGSPTSERSNRRGAVKERRETAIRCPRCGREYDISLFQFGRTIHCTCGKRVGLEQRIGTMPSTISTRSEPRFIADAMLGKVARWLRTLGYDTVCDDAISDPDLVRRSLLEDRIILTRDRKIPLEWRIDNYLVLEGDGTTDRLSEVISAMNLARPDRLFTRCRSCNAELVQVDPEDVSEEVPPRVLERNDTFSRCPSCGKIYWKGSHTERMRELIERVFEKESSSP